MNPHRITAALDMAGLVGPTADAKLGAVEPDLDNWEAGRSVPSEAQLEKLGELANLTREWFDLGDGEHPPLAVALVRMGRRCERVVSVSGRVPSSLRRQQELL